MIDKEEIGCFALLLFIMLLVAQQFVLSVILLIAFMLYDGIIKDRNEPPEDDLK